MSKRTKKSAVEKSTTSGVMQQQDPVAPAVLVGIPNKPSDPSRVPFPEWNDQDVNSEKWELVKTKPIPEQMPRKFTNSNAPQAQHALIPNASPGQFLDTQRITMPCSLDIRGWLRPEELFPNETIVMYEEFENYPDLLTASKHILHIPIYRDFISAMGILMYLGDSQPWPFEVPSANFHPVTENLAWKPHHHIYSIGKVGKGVKHSPQINTLGKYVIRLFWMGCWRKILVDDLLPVDHSNHILLPSMQIPIVKKNSGSDIVNAAAEDTIQKVERKEDKKAKASKHSLLQRLQSSAFMPIVKRIKINMWPFLLCKAIMKLASFTSENSENPKDFDIISCFTGWTMIKLNTKYLTPNDLWEVCSGYTDHFTWEALKEKSKSTKSTSSKSKSTKSDKKSKSSGKSSKSSKTSSKSKSKSSGSKKKKKTNMSVPNFFDEDDSSKLPAFYLLAAIKDMRTLVEDEVLDMSPCWSHLLLIHQSRNIPLIKPEPKPELEKWKRFRWIAWAIRNGIYVEDQIKEPLKCFKIISTFKKFYEHIVYTEPSEHSVDIKLSVDVIENVAKQSLQNASFKKRQEKAIGKVEAKKSKSKENTKKKSSKADKKSTSKSSKSKKDSKSLKSKKSDVQIPSPPDPSFWMDFYKISPYINFLYIYVKPSKFLAHCRVSDLAPPSTDKTSGKTTKGDKSPKGKSGTNQIVPQIGYTSIIQRMDLRGMCRDKTIYIFFDSVDTKYVVLSLSQVGYNYKNSSNQSDQLEGKSNEPHTYVTLERFNWNTLKINEETMILKSMGHKGLVLHFGPGRIIRRLWIKSDEPYVLLIMSDTPMYVGGLEPIAECMAQESQLVTQCSRTFSNLIGHRLQSFGSSQSLEKMREYFRMYDHMHTPFTTREKLITRQASRNAFKTMLFDIIPSHIVKDCFFALSVLYRDPSFSKTRKQVNSMYNVTEKGSTSDLLRYYEADLSEEDNFKRVQKAATKIQAFFKRVYVQILMSMSKDHHPRFAKIYDLIKYVYNSCLSQKNQYALCSFYLRRFLYDTLDRKLAEQFYVFEDMLNVVSLKHIMGTVLVEANSWSLLCRYTFFVTCLDDLEIRVILYSNLSNFIVRIIDNDTQKDLFQHSNTSLVSTFKSNVEGYTVICYGWSLNAQTISWKSSLITLKMPRNIPIIIQDTDLMRDTMHFLYWPNVNQRIFHCLVTIKQSCYLTFRISASTQNVLLKLKCSDPWGKVLESVTSRGSVVLPNVKLLLEELDMMDNTLKKKSSAMKDIKTKDSFVSLNKVKKSFKTSKTVLSGMDEIKEAKEISYILDAYVVDNSWPLSTEEWRVVDNHKLTTLLHMREYPCILFPSNSGNVQPYDENKFSSKEHVKSKSEIVSLNQSIGDSSTSRFQSVDSRRRSTKEADDAPRPIVYQKWQMLQRNSELYAISSDIQAPYWSLQTFLNKGDSVTISMDTRREREIKTIKEKWYDNDPERYEKSQSLRKNFLNHLMASQLDDSSSLDSASLKEFEFLCDVNRKVEEDASNNTAYSGYIPSRTCTDCEEILRVIEKKARQAPIYPIFQEKSVCDARLLITNSQGKTSYVSPEIFTNRINLIDLSKYMKPEKVVNLNTLERKVLTREDWDEFLYKKEEEINDFQDYLLVFKEDMNRLIGDEMATNAIMNDWIQGIRDDSDEMMKVAYKLLDGYSSSLMQGQLNKHEKAKTETKKTKNKKEGKGKGK